LEGDEDRVHGGEGYSVRGPEFQVAKGRWSQPTNILGHMLAQAQTSILRGQANWVGQSLAQARRRPSPTTSSGRSTGSSTSGSSIRTPALVRINYTAEQDPDHTIYYKVGGEPHRIWIQDRRWVSNLKKQPGQRHHAGAAPRAPLHAPAAADDHRLEFRVSGEQPAARHPDRHGAVALLQGAEAAPGGSSKTTCRA
jgi:hypothetical protein